MENSPLNTLSIKALTIWETSSYLILKTGVGNIITFINVFIVHMKSSIICFKLHNHHVAEPSTHILHLCMLDITPKPLHLIDKRI